MSIFLGELQHLYGGRLNSFCTTVSLSYGKFLHLMQFYWKGNVILFLWKKTKMTKIHIFFNCFPQVHLKLPLVYFNQNFPGVLTSLMLGLKYLSCEHNSHIHPLIISYKSCKLFIDQLSDKVKTAYCFLCNMKAIQWT